MKNSWICSAVPDRAAGLALLALLTLTTLGCGGGAAAPRSLADLINPFLGPERSAWLVGAASRLATPAETEAYLALRDDAAAEAFIDRFWAARDPSPDRPGNPVREAFEERSTEADRRYSEAGFAGRRTDRGTIHILYGPPSKTEFDVPPAAGEPPIEVWTYTSTTPAGLDGKRPAGSYRFTKRGDLTVFYVPRRIDTRLRPATAPGIPPDIP